MGFDGFVDCLIHPVKITKDEKTCEYYPTIDQFGEKITSLAGILCEKPKKTTGGGDNFNSGFCAGLLGDLDIKSCLIRGMTTLYLYVKNGACNSFDDIAEAMKMYDEEQ